MKRKKPELLNWEILCLLKFPSNITGKCKKKKKRKEKKKPELRNSDVPIRHPIGQIHLLQD